MELPGYLSWTMLQVKASSMSLKHFYALAVTTLMSMMLMVYCISFFNYLCRFLRINLPAGGHPTAISFVDDASSVVVATHSLSGSSLYMYGEENPKASGDTKQQSKLRLLLSIARCFGIFFSIHVQRRTRKTVGGHNYRRCIINKWNCCRMTSCRQVDSEKSA